MSREAFIDRVRSAAAAGRAYRVHAPGDLPARVGYHGAGDDPVARLAAEVTAAGGQAHVVEDVGAARAKLAELLGSLAPRSALCWQHPLLDRLDLSGLLAARGTKLLDHDALAPLPWEEARAAMLGADVGITSATYAIAETGTLAVAAAAGRERLASLLPPVHIALVERDQILPDLFDLFDVLEKTGRESTIDAREPSDAAPAINDSRPLFPGNLTMITGPSKTGDIELTLTTGVHGPGVWHVIVIR
jgi:L-lactate dehydrogenase complex protein LldG